MTGLHTRTVFGSLELVKMPEIGVREVLAKIDTGAYTGALHCEEIRLVRRKGKEYLQFRPVSPDHEMQEVAEFQRLKVTSASGHRTRRYAVPVKMEIKGTVYDAWIGLTKRSDLRRQMLIGRRFLRKNHILVDVCKGDQPDDEQIEVL